MQGSRCCCCCISNNIASNSTFLSSNCAHRSRSTSALFLSIKRLLLSPCTSLKMPPNVCCLSRARSRRCSSMRWPRSLSEKPSKLAVKIFEEILRETTPFSSTETGPLVPSKNSGAMIPAEDFGRESERPLFTEPIFRMSLTRLAICRTKY